MSGWVFRADPGGAFVRQLRVAFCGILLAKAATALAGSRMVRSGFILVSRVLCIGI